MDRCSICSLQIPERWPTDLGFQCSSCLRPVHLDCLNKHNYSWGVTSSYICPDCSGNLIFNGQQSFDVHQVKVDDHEDTVGKFLSYVLTSEESKEKLNERREIGNLNECRRIYDGRTNGDDGDDLKMIPKDYEKTAELMTDILPGDFSWATCSKFNFTTDPGARSQIYNDSGYCDTLSSLSGTTYHLNGISAEPNYEGLTSFQTPNCGRLDDLFHHEQMRSTHLEMLARKACVARKTADAARKLANKKAFVAAQAAIKARAALQYAAVCAKLENQTQRKTNKSTTV